MSPGTFGPNLQTGSICGLYRRWDGVGSPGAKCLVTEVLHELK
jgi:hypothetical protein